MNENSCPNCSSNSNTIINTYKNFWFFCNVCGTVTRKRKEKLAMDNKLIRSIILNTPLKNIFANSLISRREVIDNESRAYEYYHETASKGVKNTKWEKAITDTIEDFNKYNIEYTNKKVLDISGGPGFLTKKISEKAKKAIVTEFSQHAVDGMIKALDIEGVKFDYNSDQIDKCINDKFDLVLIIYSIGFCNNLKEFVYSLKKILHKDSIVYITHSPPTLGLMIRWQFADYVYNRCWPCDVFVEHFAEIGMKEKVRVDIDSYPYDKNWFNTAKNIFARFLQKFHRVIGKWYLKQALKQKNINNRELVQKNILQIFKFN